MDFKFMHISKRRLIVTINIGELDVPHIRTVKDLQNYLFTFPSPIAAQFIQDAIRFFLEPCVLEGGKKDWKAIKERKRMGMSRKLELESRLTKEICNALSLHMIHPSYGRKNADFTTLITAASLGDSSPQMTAGNLLRKIAEING